MFASYCIIIYIVVSGFSKAPGSGEEIPESVTAELEKLEREEGTGVSSLSEVEGVNAILGDLVEDDDELLGQSEQFCLSGSLFVGLAPSQLCYANY